MKNQALSILLVFAMISTANASTAKDHARRSAEAERTERINMLMNFATMGITSALIHKMSERFGMSTASKGILHTANILHKLGSLAGNSVLKDLGVRALIAGAASTIASSQTMQKDVLPNVPFVGPGLASSGMVGQNVIAIAWYQILGAAYDAFKYGAR